MVITRVEREAGDVTYKAQVLPGVPLFDGYALILIRYRWDRSRKRVVESHYWTFGDSGGQWVAYDGHRYEPIGHTRVFSLDWPAVAYEIAAHVQEPEARAALEAAIRQAERKEEEQRNQA